MIGNYILDGKTPVKCGSVHEWVQWFQKNQWKVKQEDVGDVTISTVFLGIDHGHGKPDPILFETMVFGGLFDHEQVRYSTWEEAEVGHKAMVNRVKTATTK